MTPPQSPEAPVPVWEKARIAEADFRKLPPSEQIRLEREHNPQPPAPVHSRRPVQDYRPTPEQQAELDQIANRDDKVTRYREMRDAQQQP